ncbi:MAG: hypothetical protein E7520_00985 [Ruminococcaceae bacterium]|nr:hypothetical protein [Oscillospiraceae bacterium]
MKSPIKRSDEMKKVIALLSSIIMLMAAATASFSAFAAQYQSVTGTYNYTYATEVLDLVNAERANYGLSPLTMTQSLTDGAMLRAAETTVSFSHTRPNGEQCFTAFSWSRAAGENIAYGQRSPQQVVTAWMNSSGHRANILSSNFTTVGMGCFEYGGTYYWAQAFSGGSGTAYRPNGVQSVKVNVSLTSGAQSYTEGRAVETTTQKAATTTKKAETTTKKVETTTRRAETTTRKVPGTTKQSSTTTKKAETTTSRSTGTKKTYTFYSYLRYVLTRIRYYYK